MKKRFYDFSLANVIILFLAYAFTFSLSLYTLFTSDEISIGGIIFNSLLFMSFVALIIYYGFLPVTLDGKGVRHLRKFIPREQLYWYVRPNYRLRYDEIIFCDKRIPYFKLTRKELKKNEIRVQYFVKYEVYLEENFGPADENTGEHNGKKQEN
ncbi:MAG: hypothetical protein AB7U52_05180 [Candidatus Izemoplasmatales bacterium]